MSDIKWVNLNKVLERYADAFIKNAEANLQKNDSNASGELQRSMELNEIKIDSNKMSVTISLADYWWYVEHGTSPDYGAKKSERKMPPIKPLIEWIESKPVPPKVEGLTVEQRAYGLAKHIQKHGTKPHPFFNKAKEQTYKQFKDDIAEAVQMDIMAYIEDVLVHEMKRLVGK